MSVLERIIAYKGDEVAALKRSATWRELREAAIAQGPARPFRTALDRCVGRPALIAEIKKASPSRGLIREDFNPVSLAAAYQQGGATCLSVLTDGPSFQGSNEHLVAARATCALPVLRKDFMIDPWQIAESRAIGADAVLIIMAAVDDGLAREMLSATRDFGMDALLEVHDELELNRALALDETGLIGVNNRSLTTFETDLAATERLAPLAPRDCLLVSESGIFTHADIVRLQRAGARAFLVGESLMRAHDLAGATRALLGG